MGSLWPPCALLLTHRCGIIDSYTRVHQPASINTTHCGTPQAIVAPIAAIPPFIRHNSWEGTHFVAMASLASLIGIASHGIPIIQHRRGPTICCATVASTRPLGASFRMGAAVPVADCSFCNHRWLPRMLGTCHGMPGAWCSAWGTAGQVVGSEACWPACRVPLPAPGATMCASHRHLRRPGVSGRQLRGVFAQQVTHRVQTNELQRIEGQALSGFRPAAAGVTAPARAPRPSPPPPPHPPARGPAAARRTQRCGSGWC